MTMRSAAIPAGRASKFGESTWRTPTRSPVGRSTCRGAGLLLRLTSSASHAKILIIQMKSVPDNAAWAARDLAHVWHPCTQMKDHEELPPIPIARGAGVWLEDF